MVMKLFIISYPEFCAFFQNVEKSNVFSDIYLFEWQILTELEATRTPASEIA